MYQQKYTNHYGKGWKTNNLKRPKLTTNNTQNNFTKQIKNNY